MIGQLLSHVQKLKGRSSHELYSRISQRAYAWSERAALRFGTPSATLPRVDAHTFARPFFAGISDIASTLKVLRAIAPHDETEVLERAAAIADGNIPLLGYGCVHIGKSPNWQHDPFAGLAAPLRHWSTIPYLDPAVVGDHKTVWEISRHQYFVTLGQAWSYSRDGRWPEVFTHYLHSWLDNNPAGVGMNWASSLEVSYRSISWIWALQLMHDAPAVDQLLKAKTLKSLQAHGRHLERYLSTYFSPNTHLTGEALGLFYIGTQCPELPQAKRWQKLGAQILESSLSQQVLSDGVYFEQATQYHRYTIDIYLHYLLLAQTANFAVSSEVENALHSLFDVLLHITAANGRIPLIGDDDGGRLVQLDDRLPDDVRSLLAMGAVVLKRSDLAWLGQGDDAAMCWMLGSRSLTQRDALIQRPPAVCARAFADGGIYVMRDGWDVNAGHAVIDAGPHGALSFGHSHADALAVVLTLGGNPLFVDSGTFTYVGAERDEFRTTAAHNTVEVDGVSTSQPASAFRWQAVSHPVATSWTDEPDFTYFTGQHSAYASLASPVIHERGVLHAGAGLWVIRDRLVSAGAHNAILRWHCAAAIEAEVETTAQGVSGLSLSQADVKRASMVIMGGKNGSLHQESGWVSHQFGQKSPATVLAWREATIGNAVLASIVIDSALYEVAWEATSHFREQVSGAQGLVALRSRGAREGPYTLVLVGNENLIKFGEIEIVAEIACMQVDAVTSAPVHLTAVGVEAYNFTRHNEVTFVFSGSDKKWVSVSGLGAGAGSQSVRSGVVAAPVAHDSGTRHHAASTPSTV